MFGGLSDIAMNSVAMESNSKGKVCREGPL